PRPTCEIDRCRDTTVDLTSNLIESLLPTRSHGGDLARCASMLRSGNSAPMSSGPQETDPSASSPERARDVTPHVSRDDAADLSRGDRVGPYEILDELGAGGMGKDYLVEQKNPVRRRVALKVVKLGMDSDAVLKRFEVERQALALMNHDAIARVFDAGTTPRG